jgi:hypothetical protein
VGTEETGEEGVARAVGVHHLGHRFRRHLDDLAAGHQGQRTAGTARADDEPFARGALLAQEPVGVVQPFVAGSAGSASGRVR